MRRPTLAKNLISLGVVAGLVGTLAACTGGGDSGGGSGGSTLNVAGQSDNLTESFNPYLPNTALGVMSTSQGSGGFIYEPLVQINTASIGKDIPWLAKSWEWSDGNKTLTLTLQKGATWSDGKPFTSKDVKFTYDMLKQYPALNVGGVPEVTVDTPDDTTAVMHFTSPSAQLFTSIVSAPIVPEHIWSTVGDPTKYADKDPVGTGAYEIASFSPQSVLLKANPRYWQGAPSGVTQIRFIAYKDNTAQTNALVSGQVQWGGAFIADADKTFVSKSKNNHYWAPLAGTDGLIPNLERWPLSDLQVRRAISLAVDRSQVAAATHEQPATSVTALPMPTYENEVGPDLKGKNFELDVDKAAQVMEQDGFTKESDGYYHKDGKLAKFSITFPAAYTDIASRAQVVVSQLKTFGIKVTLDTVPVNDINNLTAKGDFDSTIGYPVGPAPRAYSFYDATVNPNYYVPIGKATPAFQNIERFKNEEAAQLFKEYPNATSDDARDQILYKLEQIVADQLPIIPMFYWGNYSEWNDAKVTGFPTEDDPYFSPAPNEVVALRLKPVGK